MMPFLRRCLSANWSAHARAFRMALLVTSVVILYLATTRESLPGIDELNDKVNHIFAFVVLSFLTDYSFPSAGFRWPKILLLLGFGAGIEVIQYFLPYRESSVYDLLADGVGIFAYLMLIPVLRRFPAGRIHAK